MKMKDSTINFLDKLAMFCEDFNVTRIEATDQGRVLFLINGTEISFEYGAGRFRNIRETNYETEYPINVKE